ncbi:MAG TPA: amino acid adenylation domain-containing protein [Roseiarcus sp.]|nr:amino acid adenylation domain-containing protein [Roseiarcus sp.]
MAGLGVKPDDLVAICVERSLEMVVGLLGILKAGGAYVPLHPAWPVERLAAILEDSAPVAVLTHAPTQATIEQALARTAPRPPAIALDAEATEWASNDPADIDAVSIGLTPRRLAYIIYTSGSTGTPKGAMNEHGAVVNRLSWMQTRYGLDSTDAVLQKTPYSFDVSAWEFFWPIAQGARLVMARPGGHTSPSYLMEIIRREAITTLHFVPSMMRLFLEEAEPESCRGVRRVIAGGEALSADLISQFLKQFPGAELTHSYGPTETAIAVTAWTIVPEHAGALAPIGRPIANTRIYILDRHGEPVPTGAAGEIHIGGVPVGRGYLKRPDLTAERFLPSPFVEGDRLYKTGDLGRYLPNGDIMFLGRNDFQVKIRGFRIELGEIEARLSQHPSVREAVVLARDDSSGDKRLVAYCTPRADALPADPEALRARLSAWLPDYMVPAAYVRLDVFPLTQSGKLDRNALPAPTSDAYALHAYAAPRDETEEILAKIWAEVLKLERIGRHDNFFDLGGHSLLGLRLLVKIEKAFDRRLAMGTLYKAPTPAEMARQLAIGAESTPLFSVVPLQTREPGVPIFMIHIIERDLARHLGRRRPVYGLSYGLAAAGGNASIQFPETLEGLAAHYIEEMRSVQPAGPYRLIGHSLGGLIAYEIAQQLRRGGEKLEFVGLLDTYATDPKWVPRRLALGEVARNLATLPPKELLKSVVSYARGKIDIVARTLQTTDDGLPDLVKTSYHIRPYSGDIHLFRAQQPNVRILFESPPLPEDSWRRFALGGVYVYTLPGGHMDLVKDPVAAQTAEAIERVLQS